METVNNNNNLTSVDVLMKNVQDGGFPPFFGLFAGLVSGVDRPDPVVVNRERHMHHIDNGHARREDWFGRLTGL